MLNFSPDYLLQTDSRCVTHFDFHWAEKKHQRQFVQIKVKSKMENWAVILIACECCIVATFLLLFLYYALLRHWRFFLNRNIQFIRGWPLVGSLNEFITGKKAFADVLVGFYRRYPNEPVIGIYNFCHPVFLMRDVDLIMKITIQDFDHFLNHSSNFDVSGDLLMSQTLFFSRDQKWKDMRSVLSPAFTGNKMRHMFELIQESTTELVQTLRHIYTAPNPKATQAIDGFEVEMKDVLSRYTTNMIATCAFGLKVDAIAQRDNEFYLATKKLTNFDGIQGVKFLLTDIMPLVMKTLRITFVPETLCNYFRSVINSTIRHREENNIYRPDMVHLLMQAKKGTLVDDEDDVHRTKKTSRLLILLLLYVRKLILLNM